MRTSQKHVSKKQTNCNNERIHDTHMHFAVLCNSLGNDLIHRMEPAGEHHCDMQTRFVRRLDTPPLTTLTRAQRGLHQLMSLTNASASCSERLVCCTKSAHSSFAATDPVQQVVLLLRRFRCVASHFSFA